MRVILSLSRFRFLVWFAILPLACSCERKKSESSATLMQSPEVIYNQGLRDLKLGKFYQAGKKFQDIDKKHPYSARAGQAILLEAVAYYRDAKYEEAIEAATRYTQLYTTSPDIAYAWYLIGLCHFQQIKDVSRDQTPSHKLIEAMQELILRSPNAPYVPDARKKILFARNQIAGHEMQIGYYYLKRREYTAAIGRFRHVFENARNTPYAEEALALLAEACYAMGLLSEYQVYVALLERHYPNGHWLKVARRLGGAR